MATTDGDPLGAGMKEKGYDVVVVGAGPAGAMAARESARRGASVLLVDRASFPRWKVCGACLGPGGLQALHRAGLGSLPERLGAIRLVSFSVATGGRTARLRLQGNVALSRMAFDHALVEEALTEGVTLRTSTRATLLAAPASSDYRTIELARVGGTDGDDETVHAGVVVDATGLGGGLGETRPEVSAASRVGAGAVFEDAPSDVLPGDLHMIVDPTGYVGLVRDEAGRLNVAAALDRATLAEVGVAEAVRRIVGARTGGAALERDPELGWKGTPALTRRHGRLAEHRLFRVGDAGGYVEPFTGEGMGWALSSGIDVASFVRRGLDAWTESVSQEWHRDQSRRMARSQRFCRLLSGGLRRPGLVRASVRLLERYPSAAGPLVAAGSLPVHS